MKVIARIYNDFPEKFGVPRQSGLVPELMAWIVFEPEYRNPDALKCPSSPEPDQTKRFRAQRALDAALGQQPIDEDRAAELIKVLAEAEYELIDSNEYETERLRRIFREAEPMHELSADLLRKTVAEISVEIKTIQLILKNNQIIEVSDAS